MKQLLLFVCLLQFTAFAKANTLFDVCNSSTLSSSLYRACMQSCLSAEQAAACLDGNFLNTNVKLCFSEAKKRNLQPESISYCSKNAKSKEILELCLENIEK